MSRFVRRLAARAPAAVFPIVGCGGMEIVRRVRASVGIRLVDTPRHADILFVAGSLPRRLLRPALRVHDQMPHPRSTVVWASDREGQGPDRDPTWSNAAGRLFPDALRLSPAEDVAMAIRDRHRDLMRGDAPSEPSIRPEESPIRWRGVGPYGHGGKGMTGGLPYGRPMPTRAADRDGLQLDTLPLRIGPFFPPLPTGLLLNVVLQGDVIQEASVGPNPFTGQQRATGDPFVRALDGEVSISEMELARARHHLFWMADGLRTAGLEALGLRALRLGAALSLDTVTASARAVRRLALWGGRLRSVAQGTSGIGRIARERTEEHWGPVSRASGLKADARRTDPGYIRLGFEPIVMGEGDAWARWRQRIAECLQSLDLAGRAGESTSGSIGSVESPRGRLSRGVGAVGFPLERLPTLLSGLEWGDMVTTLVSLDLDLEDDARLASAVGEMGSAP